MNRAMAQEDAPIVCADLMSEETCLAPDCAWQDEACIDALTPESPATSGISDNQIVNINPVDGTDTNWQPNKLQTYAIKFLIRGKEALTWSLAIKDAGFHNPAIQTSYVKVLTIVNSLFILGMLAIAAMWMFSIFIPRRQLRKVVLIYAAAVIFVNFALPVTRLLIDSTNLLQRTLLVQDGNKIEIADIVQTNKTYAETLGYMNKESATENVYEKTEISIPSSPGMVETEVGKISDVALVGTSGVDSVAIGQQDPGLIKLDTNKPLTIESRTEFFPESESAIFAFVMVMLTGVAYFILSLIFVLRIIILWALLILSPALILLAIFRATRGWFMNWLAIYGRWLLIGPLTALGIAVIVNIWKMAGGTPITNEYVGETFAENLTNISFVLPGGGENTLSTTGQMMEYIVFLMMLYIPIFFAFVLTRQKLLRGAATTIVEGVKGKTKAIVAVTPETAKPVATGTAGVIGTLKDMFSGQIAKVTQTVMPAELRAPGYAKEHFAPSASNFLPENLALTSTRGMMELLGVSKESRHGRDVAIEKLASPNMISDPKEREKHSSVRNEIEKRAMSGDAEASILMNEIRDKQASAGVPVATPTMGPVMAGAGETRVETRTEGAKIGPLTERVETRTVEKGTVTKTEGKAITPVKAEKKKLEEGEKKKEEEGEEKEEAGEDEKTEAKAEDGSEKKEKDEGELNVGEEKNF
jgi:hypothetical protein